MQEKVQELLEFDQVIYCDIELSKMSLYISLKNINIYNFYKYIYIYIISHRIPIPIVNPRIAPINLN